MSSCTRRAPVRVICENLEPRRLFAMQVFFQDFDKPDDDWQTGPNRFIEPGGAAAGARREVAESGNVLDFRYLRGNWAQNVTDEVIGDPPTPSNLRSRFTNVAIGVASRGLSEFYLNHWVWFDAGVENFEDENIKFVQFDGGDVVATDFDWFVDLNGNNFDTYHLRNNSNGNVGGPDSAGVKFSDLPGARELMGNMSPANWFRGR